ncbi:MAG TPA: EipA family protein [Burkholderiales bacterium]|nr:EipA family protein [Burkholderiales bacterium]
MQSRAARSGQYLCALTISFHSPRAAVRRLQRRDKIVLGPIRLGVGLRAGASVGYIHYTKQKTINPF